MGQIEENIKRFMNSQEKAKKLIQMDARGELNKYKDKAREAYKLANKRPLLKASNLSLCCSIDIIIG